LGGALKKLGRFKEAIQYYDKALAIDPNDSVVLHNKGRALSEQGKFVEAIQLYDLSLSINPDNLIVLDDKSKAFELLDAQFGEVSLLSKPLDSEFPIGLGISFIVLAITIGFASYSAVRGKL